MPRPRARAVATALRRQREPQPWLPWLALLAALIASVAATHAQTPVPLVLPGVTIVQRASPGIGGTVSVIPPPGMQGGNQPVITGSTS